MTTIAEQCTDGTDARGGRNSAEGTGRDRQVNVSRNHGGRCRPGNGQDDCRPESGGVRALSFPSITNRGVLVFGPNRRFLTYISDVLPSLGENDVQLATLSNLIGVEATTTEADQFAPIKGRAKFADGLARWVKAREPYGMPLELQTAHGTVVLDSELVDTARRSALQRGIGHNRAWDLFTEQHVAELVNDLKQQTTRELSDFEAAIKEFLGIDLYRIFAGDPRRGRSDDVDASAGGSPTIRASGDADLTPEFRIKRPICRTLYGL